jgi:endonuclease YncB( thermonuclease family)
MRYDARRIRTKASIFAVWQNVLLAAISLGIATAARSAAIAGEPPVKKSNAGVCHVRGTHGYEQTTHYKAFDGIEACLNSGGRLPQNSSTKKPFDPSRPVHPGDEGVLYGPLVRVKDGDTLVVKIQGAELDFRLSGIDAPEHDQPFGPQARDALAEMIGTQQCVLRFVEPGAYSRLVAYLWIGDVNVNEELMKRGMGWYDSENGVEPFLYQLETEARAAKRGLWAAPVEKRVAPWVWRKEER